MSFLPPIKRHESTGSKAHGSRQLHLASSVILILGMLLIGLALKGPMVPVQAAPIVDHPSASVIYVSWSATGLNTGTSWVDAYTSLHSALTAAANGDEIWVAAGIYTPTLRTNPSDQRTATFQLKSGVGLYGGFAGSETARDQRDWNTHISVLSGDLDSNDITDPNGVVTNTTNIVGNNAYHVLSSGNVVSTTVLDGFIVTGGQATASAPNNRGGGLYNDGGSPRVAHMTFSGNRAGYGGGVYDEIGSNLTLVNVTFNSNSAQASGGGVLDDRGAVTMINTVFNGNVAATEGGGLYVRYDTATLENCVFNGNISGTTGGGLWNEAGQSTVVNCTFSGNTAPIEGGALYDWGVGTASIIRNSILWGNTAPTNPQIGGGTANVSTSLVQGGWSGTGNLSADPQFVRNPSPGLDGTWGTSDDDYGDLHLRPTSPAIDAGNNSAVPTDSTDLDGNPRIMGTAIDMGAYEAVIGLTGALSFSPDPVGAGQPIMGNMHITNTGVLTLHAILTGTLSPHIVSNAPLTWTTVITPNTTWTQMFTGTVELGYRGPVTGTLEATTLEGPADVFTATATALVPISGLTATNNSPTHLGNTTILTAAVTAGDAVTYAWSFGDATSGSGSVITHTYPALGIYAAVVTASNAVSVITATTSVTITTRLYLPLIIQDLSPER